MPWFLTTFRTGWWFMLPRQSSSPFPHRFTPARKRLPWRRRAPLAVPMPETTWVILTGEYPPQPGGVADYTRLLARGLAQAGDRVHVWSGPCSAPTPVDSGVHVHRLPGRFGPASLVQLHRELGRLPGPYRLLVQYVPHAFGMKAMNVPF